MVDDAAERIEERAGLLCEREKLADASVAAPCDEEARFTARMLNLANPDEDGDDLRLCEKCLRLAMGADLVVFSSARFAAAAPPGE